MGRFGLSTQQLDLGDGLIPMKCQIYQNLGYHSYFHGSPSGFWPHTYFLHGILKRFFFLLFLKNWGCFLRGGDSWLELTSCTVWMEWMTRENLVQKENVAAPHGSICSVDLTNWFQTAEPLRQTAKALQLRKCLDLPKLLYIVIPTCETSTLRCWTRQLSASEVRSDEFLAGIGKLRRSGWWGGARWQRQYSTTSFSIRANVRRHPLYNTW